MAPVNYIVTVKPNHPTGIRRRAGREFTQSPTVLSEQECTKEIGNDPWLMVRTVEAPMSAAHTTAAGEQAAAGEQQSGHDESAGDVADPDDPAPRRGRKK